MVQGSIRLPDTPPPFAWSLRRPAAWCAVLGLAVAAGGPGSRSARSDAPRYGVVAPSGYSWRYPTEQVWLVTETLRNLGGLTEFARSGTAADRDAGGVEVRVDSSAAPGHAAFQVQTQDGASFRLDFDDHIFSTRVYGDVALRWLGSRPARQPTPSRRRLPERLLDLRLPVLQDANLELSRSLTEDPRSPEAHDDAAFLLVAFELRERAAGHTDPRRVLARITAHLAMARALRVGAGSSATGRLAEIGGAVLSGRMADAVSRLDAATGSDEPGLPAWGRALRLYATEDWRLAAWSDPLTLVERFAWLAAFRIRVGTDRAHLFVQSLPSAEQRLPDWGRILLKGWPSVQDCHAFAIEGVTFDRAEADEASRLFRGTGVDSDAALAIALNEEAPASPVRAGPEGARIEVLDWGTVASFVQRHIGARLSYEAGCYERTLGLPSDTRRVLKEQEEQFGALTLFPIEAHRWAKTREEHQRYARPAVKLVQQRPELVTPHLWSILLDLPAFSAPLEIPLETDWLVPPMPFGTNFGDGRLYGPQGKRKVPTALYDTLVRLNPYDAGLRWAQLKLSMGDNLRLDQAVEAVGPSQAWDVPLMAAIGDLSDGDPGERRRWLGLACQLDEDFCGRLASFLAEKGDDDEAARVYYRYWRQGLDRVGVSRNMGWLVEHERGLGHTASAFEIARDAAATYSYMGLRTLADLAENTGDLEEAESSFRSMAERYESADDLFAFYGRRLAAGKLRYRESQDRLVGEVFPGGLEKMDRLPTEAPADGVVFSDVTEPALSAGFANGDIAVALDGVRLHARQQWRILRDRSTDPDMRVVIFRDGTYREVRCRASGRIIQAMINGYPETR